MNEVHTKLNVHEGGWGRGREERDRNAQSERLCPLMLAGGTRQDEM